MRDRGPQHTTLELDISHLARRPPGTGSIDRLRRGIAALVAGVAALILQGDVGVFELAVAVVLGLVVFELLGGAWSRWTPSKDPDDYRD